MDAELDENFDTPEERVTPELSAEISIESEKLADVMKTLSPRDQQILDLRFFAGLEPQEIAEVMELSPNHASVLVYRALGRLRKKYNESYA